MPFDNVNYESDVTKSLRAARALIEKGWISYNLKDNKGGFCALGAVYETMHMQYQSVESVPLLRLLAKHAKFRGVYCGLPINDDTRMTAKIASHNNMLGREATLVMFDDAIADSIGIDVR